MLILVLDISFGDETFKGLCARGEKDSHDFFPDDVNKKIQVKTKHKVRYQVKEAFIQAFLLASMQKCKPYANTSTEKHTKGV